jgi:lysozyme
MEKIMTFNEYHMYNEGITIGDELKEVQRKIVSAIKKVSDKQIKVRDIAFSMAVAGLVYIHGEDKVGKAIESDMVSSVAKEEKVSLPDKQDISKLKKVYKPGHYLSLSKDGIEKLKREEGKAGTGDAVLKAYKLGDKMITIGWGHAEPIEDTERKVGDEITLEEAERLLKEDIKIATDGIHRIFKEWEDKGIIVPVTQTQFDVLVSLAFNTGVGAIRKSSVIRQLKRGRYEAAGKEILTYNLGKDEHRKGIEARRKRESKLFLEGH